MRSERLNVRNQVLLEFWTYLNNKNIINHDDHNCGKRDRLFGCHNLVKSNSTEDSTRGEDENVPCAVRGSSFFDTHTLAMRIENNIVLMYQQLNSHN